MTKEEREILEDFQGYIQFELDNDDEDTRMTRVLSTLGHDIGGLFHNDDCFLPRTDGYREHRNPGLMFNDFCENERGNLWITQQGEELHLAYFLLDGNPNQVDEKMTLLEASVFPCNYPGFHLQVIKITPNKLAKDINEAREGWLVKKLNLVPDGSVKVEDGFVVGTMKVKYTDEEVLRMLNDPEGRAGLCTEIVERWWDAMDLGDAERGYIYDVVNGRKALIDESDDKIMIHLFAVGLMGFYVPSPQKG